MSAPCPTYGFTIALAPHAGTTDARLDAMRADLHRLLDAHDLVTTAAPRALVLAVTREGSQATDADRTLVQRWSEQWTHAAAVRVSELVDLSA